MKRSQYNKQVKKALELYEKAGIVLTDKEKASIEVVDFEKGVVNELGLQLLTYINTERVCAKEMVLLSSAAKGRTVITDRATQTQRNREASFLSCDFIFFFPP